VPDIVLVNPPAERAAGPLGEHLGLGYMSSSLKAAGMSVTILDAYLDRLSLARTVAAIEAESPPPRILGFTLVNEQAWHRVQYIVRQLRDDGYDPFVVLGGYYATFWYDRLLANPTADAVVLGEGEATMVELAGCVMDGGEVGRVAGLAYRDGDAVRETAPRRMIANLDELPFPDRPRLKETVRRGGIPSVFSSRGCFHACSFCQVSQLWRRQPGPPYRARSVENVLREIESIVAESGARAILFTDGEFIGSGRVGRARAWEFGRELMRRGLDVAFGVECRVDSIERELFAHLKNAGLALIFVGLESMTQRSLDSYHKRTTVATNLAAIDTLESLGLDYDVGLLLHDPYTTVEELKETVNWLRRIPSMPLALIGVNVLRGTPLADNLRETGLLDESEMTLAARPVDPAIRKLELVLRQYINIYVPATNNLMDARMLLMTVSGVPTVWRQRFDQARARLKTLHLQFLDDIVRCLGDNDYETAGTVLTDMGREFAVFTPETESILRGVRHFAGFLDPPASSGGAIGRG